MSNLVETIRQVLPEEISDSVVNDLTARIIKEFTEVEEEKLNLSDLVSQYLGPEINEKCKFNIVKAAAIYYFSEFKS